MPENPRDLEREARDEALTPPPAVVAPPLLVHERAIHAPRVVLTMPLDWVAHGFLGAIHRVFAAHVAHRTRQREGRGGGTNPMQASLALFEASTWMDSLIEQRPDFAGDPRVRALVFARQRIHHNWAAAIRFDPEQKGYVWISAANYPLPRKEFDRNPEGEHRYSELLAGRPIMEVLLHLEKRVIALATKA